MEEKRILVIDDDKDWQNVIQYYWEKYVPEQKASIDFCLVDKANPREEKIFKDETTGTPTIKTNQGDKTICDYDIIFLDLYLGERHGVELPRLPTGGEILKEFRKYELDLKYVPPVIILSGSQNLERALYLKSECGAFDYLCKIDLPEELKMQRKVEEWKTRIEEDLGLAKYIEKRRLRGGVMSVKRITEIDPNRFWFGYKVPSVVDHSWKHALGVWKILYRWLKDSPLIKKLGDNELYILLMSALLHDIGHCGNEDHFDAVNVREMHGIITENLLTWEKREENEKDKKNGWEYYGFRGNSQIDAKTFAKAVGLICKYHEGRFPLTKKQKMEPLFINRELELFSEFCNGQSLEESWKILEDSSSITTPERALLLEAFLMFADAVHIEESRVDGDGVHEARNRVIDRDGAFLIEKLLSKKEKLIFWISSNSSISPENCRLAKKKFDSLFKQREKEKQIFQEWKLTNEEKAIKWYRELQSIIPIYDIDLLHLVKYITLLAIRGPHYRKHRAVPSKLENDEYKVKTIDFSNNISNPPEKYYKAIFEFGSNKQVGFRVAYILKEEEKVPLNNAKENAKWIKGDLLYEWMRIQDIITLEWTGNEKEHWEMMKASLLKHNGDEEPILLDDEEKFQKPKK